MTFNLAKKIYRFKSLYFLNKSVIRSFIHEKPLANFTNYLYISRKQNK